MLSNLRLFPLRKGGVAYLPFLSAFVFLVYPTSLFSSGLYKFHQVAMGTGVEITLMGESEESAQKAALRAFQEMNHSPG